MEEEEASSSSRASAPPAERSQRRRRAAAIAAVAGAAGAAAGDSGGRRPRGIVCTHCRKLKVLCEGAFPCARCWRLALPCRPQAYTHPGYEHLGARAQQGRSEQEEEGDEKQQGEAQEEKRPQPERRSKRRRAVLQRQEREAAAAAKAAAEAASPSPRLLEMAFTRASPRMHAELASQAFMALHAQGQVAPEKALFIMRMYIDLARLMGTDPTWGYVNVMAGALGCTPMDITTPDELLLDPPPAQREAALRQRAQGVVPAIEQIREHPFFQQFEASAPNAAIYMGVICPDGAFVEVSNRLFDASFLASHSFYDEVFRRKTISPFLFPSLVDPDDRRALLNAIIRAGLAATPKKETLFIKAFDSQGEVHLYLVEVLPGVFPTAAPTSLTMGIAVLMERLPASRHLTLRPGRNELMQSFQPAEERLSTPRSSSTSAAAAVPAAAREVLPSAEGAADDSSGGPGAIGLLPGLACFPAGPAGVDPSRVQAIVAAQHPTFQPPPPPQQQQQFSGAGGGADRGMPPMFTQAAPAPVATGWEGTGVERELEEGVVDVELLQAVFQEEQEQEEEARLKFE